jgi:hypothetical protein
LTELSEATGKKEESSRALRVFLCHASEDKALVRRIFEKLSLLPGIDPWLDEQKLIPGQDWTSEITKAVRSSDVAVVCLSRSSTTKEGYVQKEIRLALDVAEEKPEGTIFLVPLRLEACEVPNRLRRWQWVDLFAEWGYDKLLSALCVRADSLGLQLQVPIPSAEDAAGRGTIDEFNPKVEVLRASGLVESVVTDQRFEAIGGLDVLKDWLRARGKGFSSAEEVWRLPQPRGVLLIGPPGCGKSLIVKATANEWGMPLLRMDFGRVFGVLVGTSEPNVGDGLSIVEGFAPCVLWVDEVKLRTSAAGHRNPYQQAILRILNALLSWMADERGTFVMVTSPDVENVPPELLRKGRLDEVFFVDLPNELERLEILDVHLRKIGQDPERFALKRYAALSDGFSGAELESAVVSAAYEAVTASVPLMLTDRHLERAISQISPFSRSIGPQIEVLRRASAAWRKASKSNRIQ